MTATDPAKSERSEHQNDVDPASVAQRTRSARLASREVQILGVRSPLHVSGPTDTRIAAIGALQRGRVSRRQLRAAGIGRGAVARRVARGSLLPVHRQVLAIGHLSSGPLLAETSALLAVPGDALLSHRSAAALWGLMTSPEAVHVLVEGSPPRDLAGVVAHRTRNLIPTDCRIHQGLPVTSPARTMLDCAELVPARVLERAVETAAVSGLMRPGELDNVLQRGRGRPGTALLREIAGTATTTITRSEAEERMLALLRDADLPLPHVNSMLHGYEVDLLWPTAGLVVEIDGYRFHSSRAAFERDRLRDARLQAAGIVVLRVTWRQLTTEPLAVIAHIASALVRRQDVALLG